jgi:hypothetical protein
MPALGVGRHLAVEAAAPVVIPALTGGSDMKAFVVAACLGLIFLGCGGGSGGYKPTVRCVLNSECTGLLACVQGYCINACDKSKDCLNGARCIKTDQGNYCQPEERRTCVLNSECTTPLVCGVDRQCRNQCADDRDCLTNQVCTKVTKLCADPDRDKDYDPATQDFKVADGGALGTDGAAGADGGDDGRDAAAGADGGDAAGGGAGTDGGAGASGGDGGVLPPLCTTGQTQFNDIAVGDANPYFTSGVGVRNGTTFFVFSSYAGPAAVDDAADADAAVPTVNAVYVQAFDVAGGAKRGPARQLFATTDGPYFYVHDVSIAPTGEIALLYGHASPTEGRQNELNIAFLSTAPAAASDGGVSDLQVKKTQLIETVPLSAPHVVWSHAKQAFVASWKYLTTNWFTRIRTFSTNGSSSGGLNVVPTPLGFDNDQNTEDARVGLSGGIYGAIHRDYNSGRPELTVLDSTEQLLGFVELSTLNIGWAAAGGTREGLLGLYNNGATVYATYVPTASVAADGGAPDGGGGDGGTDGGAPTLATFSFPSTARSAQAVSDDPAASGGVGAALLEPNGANFLFVTADGARRSVTGTVLTSANSAQVAISNYRGSFAVSLYDRVTHSTQITSSGCQ